LKVDELDNQRSNSRGRFFNCSRAQLNDLSK